ncbi:hypothetical protein BGZ76_005990, partial [Entomortierella beljakovae]
MDSGLGYAIASKKALMQYHSLPTPDVNIPDISVNIAALAFVDDTTWVAPNKENLQGIIEIAMEFFDINHIEINPKKTELIVINPVDDQPTIQFGNDGIPALPSHTAARMLGVWFSADGKNHHTKKLVQNEVSSICSILARKAITDKQAIYIVNNVLIPRILYRLTTTILPSNMIQKLTAQYTGMVRAKIGYAKGTPNSILYHRRLYGLRKFEDVQAEEQISTALLRYNDHGIVGKVMSARAMAHQIEARLPLPTLQLPAYGAQFTTHNLLGGICQLLQDRQIDFTAASITPKDKIPVATIFTPPQYKKIAVQMYNDGVNQQHVNNTQNNEESEEDEPLQDNRPSRRAYVLAQQQTSDTEQNDGVPTLEPGYIAPVIRNQAPPMEATDSTKDLAITELEVSSNTAIQQADEELHTETVQISSKLQKEFNLEFKKQQTLIKSYKKRLTHNPEGLDELIELANVQSKSKYDRLEASAQHELKVAKATHDQM